MRLEICVDSLESLLAAQEGGANRIELCSALELGGLTPSYGLMKAAAELDDLEIFVMIRPRSGDFYYSDFELETMKKDIEVVKDLGLDGVVFGLQKKDGSLDIEKMANLIKLAKPLKVSLHRAFDNSKSPQDQMDDLIKIGLVRILTSGLEENAEKGKNFIRDLQKKYGSKIEIMPGAGITSKNLESLYQTTQCISYHMSAKKLVTSKLEYKGKIKFSEDDYHRFYVDKEEVTRARQILNKLENSGE